MPCPRRRRARERTGGLRGGCRAASLGQFPEGRPWLLAVTPNPPDMIIPRHWAEARAQGRDQGRKVTVRRFGWSADDPAAAQMMAEARAAEGLRRTLAGEKVARSEPKVPYNGAEGVPIREEVVAEHGNCVITRNSYGALCLNTPDVLFADVDFAEAAPERFGCLAALAAIAFGVAIGVGYGSALIGIVGVLVGVMAVFWSMTRGYRLWLLLRGGSERLASGRLRAFAAAHPDWKLRVYRTPAGFRVLALHRTFAPDSPEVAELFAALKCDPVYVQMCRRQQCFRARVSPKPWRIGIADHLRPRPGVWPVRAEALPARRDWIEAYHAKAAGFAACRFEMELGQGNPDGGVRAVQELHDRLCRAGEGLPIA